MYGQVDVVFWRDDVMRACSEDARHLMLYLLTCPHRTRLGVFVLDPWYAAADVQWDISRVEAARDELVERGRIQWHPEVGVVVLINWWKRNVLQNQRAALGGVQELADLPDGPFLVWLRDELEERGRAHYRALVDAVDSRVEKWSSGNPPGPGSGSDRQKPRANSVNSPANSRASSSVPIHSGPNRSSSPESKIAPESPREADPVLELPDAAIAALRDLNHPQGAQASARVLRSRFLYADSDADLAHESVRGLARLQRVRLVAAALVEMGSQRDTFNPAGLAAFVRTLRQSPQEGTEAAAVARTEARKPYRPDPRSTVDLSRIDFKAMLTEAGVSPPAGPRLVTDDPDDVRSA